MIVQTVYAHPLREPAVAGRMQDADLPRTREWKQLHKDTQQHKNKADDHSSLNLKVVTVRVQTPASLGCRKASVHYS